MEWIQRPRSSRDSVAPAELKICDLCGTLNHHANRECFMCGWHGCFGNDTTTVRLAWQRLHHQHEGVLIEHVTARTTAGLDEFGRPRQTNILQRMSQGIRAWWENAVVTRRVRCTPRIDAPLPASPQTDL